MSSFLTETPLKSNLVNNINNQNVEEQYVNENATSRKIEFDRGKPLTLNFCSNKVRTIPFSTESILYFLWYAIGGSPFLITIILVLIFYLIVYISSSREIASLELHYSVAFHIVMLIIQIILGIAKFIQICSNDSKVNNQPTKIYDFEKKAFINAKWKDIKVGQIIRVNQDEIVPADIIILEAMDHNHQCYVDYSSINGVFDSFTLKTACNDTHAPSMKTIKFNEYVKNIKGVLKYEEPNSNMHTFIGRLKLESFPRASDITDDNFVMRGSTIKNIKWVYGFVVYTGMEAKIMQTLKISESKGSKINTGIMKRDRDIINITLKFIQYILVGLYLALLVISILIELYKVIICYYSFQSPIGDDHSYLMFNTVENVGSFEKMSDPFFEMFLSVVQFALTYHLILPFDWFGLIDIAYLILSKFIQWDYKVLLKPKNSVEIINKNCLADFGQVRHILTDKTGTLTSRKLLLKACSIHGKLFSFDPQAPRDENYIFKTKPEDLSQLEVFQELKISSLLSTKLKEFFECLCICHSVKVSLIKTGSNDTEEPKPILGSCYAEEKAMLKTIDKIGFKVRKTKNSKIYLNIKGENKSYYVLGYNKYTEERRRMSVLIKKSNEDNESILLCKGNDFSIFSLCKHRNETELAKTKLQIKELSKHGYRFFIFCKRSLNEDETNIFLTKYKSAENYVVKSEEHLRTLAIEYEKELDYLGVLFFEEKVPGNLKFCINKLNFCGIKIWVASGDKRENVLSVAKNLNLFNPNTIRGDFSDKDKPEDLDIKMSMLLMQFLFPNEKISKMKTRKGVNIETQAQVMKGSKELTIVISGNCFARIYADQRNFQSLATLLSYCTNLIGYSFNPNNKYLLCQMIRKYVANNSKVLAVGDGFNDFTMLKEADLSVGIRSNEILQVRNSCDVIVNKFSQITDLILVHGTFNYHRLMSICLLTFYSNFLIVFPMFIHQNSNPIGSTFYIYSPRQLILEILTINLSIIFLFVFDTSVERSMISINPNVYKDNLYDRLTLIFEFGLEFIKSGADSLLLYYLLFSLLTPINSLGENPDGEMFTHTILYTSYCLILLKGMTLRLNTINYMHILTILITIGALIGIAFVDSNLILSICHGFSYFSIVFFSLLCIGICFLYEYTARTIMNIFMSPNFIVKLTLSFYRMTKENLLFKNWTSLYAAVAKEMPSTLSKIDKITYPEVLAKIFAENNVIDPSLENMADVSNEEIALIKIKKPNLCFHDQKSEEDFIAYSSINIKNPFLAYLASNLLFWIADTAFNGFEKGDYVYRILNIVYILIGLVFLMDVFKRNFDKVFPIYFFLILTIEIICIYVQKDDNDIKICLKACVLFSFPLFFSTRRGTVIFPGIIYYIIGITPGIYLNDFGFTENNKERFFLYSNLPLLYHRNVFIYATVIIYVVFSYYSELESRIEFLKYSKSKVELKKDNLIIGNLIPEFVRDKLTKGERGAALGYEIVTIVFCDISDFDSLVAKLTPKELIYFLDEFYSLLDQFCFLHGLQKIETVGKTYMAAGGIKECEVNFNPLVLMIHHAIRSFEFGIDILDLILKMGSSTGDKLTVKIGIHTGKVIPAVVGNHKPQFSLIGDAVNTTARMCAHSSDNCINCSQFTYEEIKEKYKDFTVTTKEVKGKGMMNLYLFNPLKNKSSHDSKQNQFPRDSSGNVIMRSLTRNCPIILKQNTKTSFRNQNTPYNNSRNINNKNDISPICYKPHNSINKNNSYFIIENSFDGFIDDTNNSNKKKARQSYALIEKEAEVNEENSYFKNSFLFYRFKEEAAKNGFARFERHKFKSSENISIIINVVFALVFLIGIYFMSQYALLDDENVSIFIIINGILLILLVGIIYQTKVVIQHYGPFLSWVNFSIYFLFTIVNQVEMNIIKPKFLINLAVEEVFILLAVNFNGMLSHNQLSICYGLNIIEFIINIGVNTSNDLIMKYCIFLIVISIVLYVFRFFKYYQLTMDFQRNQIESKTLEATEKILFNLMPLHVVQNMKDDIPVADVLDNVTMLFADIVRFTDFSACHEPVEVVDMLSELFMRFDNSTKECSVYKVHTIGDCYVVLGFTGKVPMNERNYYEEAKNVCKMGENMITIIREVRRKVNFEKLDMRIGIHTGPVIAGIIGSAVVRYDIFGSDVLIANKMESAGLPGYINISEDTKKLLETKECPYTLNLNKVVEIPSVGKEVKCYFIENPQDQI